MKKILITALALAAIGSQVANAASTATMKLGVLSFALTDTLQGPTARGVHDQLAPGKPAALETVPFLAACAGSYKYSSSQGVVNNPAIFRAISSAWDPARYFSQLNGSGNGVFTPKAKLVILNYDNDLVAPPYPPYLPELGPNLGAANTYNGPLIQDPVPFDESAYFPVTTFGIENFLVDWALANDPVNNKYVWTWPNLHQIDWVDYDGWSDVDLGFPQDESLDRTLRPYDKALVYISDPTNVRLEYQCLNVSPFFSFEEAYCYFCWDTVDRVTDGTFLTGGRGGDVCLGNIFLCASKGSGTTRWYLTIKFNNQRLENEWLIKETGLGLNDLRPWLIRDAYMIPLSGPGADSKLSFSVAGVVNYPWMIKIVQGVPSAFGTMTMAQANGFASNPWCGVLRGSVTVTETTDLNIPVGCSLFPWQTPWPAFSGK
jgi:hypothetical protein